MTIEDILEEIVGEIQDEYDTEPPLVEALPDGAYVVNAGMEMTDEVHWGDLYQRNGGLITNEMGLEIAGVLRDVGPEIKLIRLRGNGANFCKGRQAPQIDREKSNCGNYPGRSISMIFSLLNEMGKR